MLLGLFNTPLYFVGVICRFFTSLFVGGRTAPSPEQNATQNSSGGQKKEAKTERNGNVGRFRVDESDHSDNEATWNGNSTQQL